MQYFGGKHRLAKTISRFLEFHRKPGQAYLEPFVGGANIVARMTGERCASDANGWLITMWQALQDGWVPPDAVTQEQHAWYRKHKPAGDPMTAFVGFGCSFGGIWSGGYAGADKRNGQNYAAQAKRGCLRKIATMRDVVFRHCSYLDWAPEGMLIYCDPPYEGVTGYAGVGAFDHVEFWATVRKWSANNTVVISEYQAPSDFRCVAEMPTRLSVRSKKGAEPRIERLFQYDP